MRRPSPCATSSIARLTRKKGKRGSASRAKPGSTRTRRSSVKQITVNLSSTAWLPVACRGYPRKWLTKLDLPEEYTPSTEISGHQDVRLACDSSRLKKPRRRLIRSNSRKLSTTLSRIGFSCFKRRFRSRSLWLTRCSVAIRTHPLPHGDQCGRAGFPPGRTETVPHFSLIPQPEKMAGGKSAIH